MLLTRRPFGMKLVLLAFVATVAGTAPAHALVQCNLTGHADGYQIFRVDLPLGAGGLAMSTFGHVDITGPGDSENYYASEGLQIFDGRTGRLEASMIHGLAGQRPNVIVQSGSTTVVNQDFVGSPVSGSPWARFDVPGGLNPGSHYIIAFGFGSQIFDSFVRFNELSGTATCVPVTPSAADKFKLDHTDFSGSGGDIRLGGQVNALGVGQGAGLKMSFSTSRRIFAGYAATGFGTKPSGNGSLDITAPTYHQVLQWGQSSPLGTSPGTYSFKLNYSGLVMQHAHIDGWAFDLPVT